MISVRTDIADAQRSVRRNLLLDLQRPGFDGWRAQVRLHAARNDFRAGVGSVRGDARKGDALGRVNGIEGRVLVQAIAQIVHKRVVDRRIPRDTGFFDAER